MYATASDKQGVSSWALDMLAVVQLFVSPVGPIEDTDLQFRNGVDFI